LIQSTGNLSELERAPFLKSRKPSRATTLVQGRCLVKEQDLVEKSIELPQHAHKRLPIAELSDTPKASSKIRGIEKGAGGRVAVPARNY